MEMGTAVIGYAMSLKIAKPALQTVSTALTIPMNPSLVGGPVVMPLDQTVLREGVIDVFAPWIPVAVMGDGMRAVSSLLTLNVPTDVDVKPVTPVNQKHAAMVCVMQWRRVVDVPRTVGRSYRLPAVGMVSVMPASPA